MKKIIIGLAVIAAVGAVVVYGTGAFFSDTETSTGNTFTAGALDLKVDSNCTYNGEWQEACSWKLADLTTGMMFFNYDDIKPGDYGEDTVSLHVIDNPAYVCASIENLTNADNGITEPEGEDGDMTDGVGYGELQNEILFTVWQDTGIEMPTGEVFGTCDNEWQEGEQVLVDDDPATTGYWPIADSQTGGPMDPEDGNYCVGISWTLPGTVNNIVQTDSMTADVSFYAIQARHNDGFVCGPAT